MHASGYPEALLVDPGDEPERVLDAVADLHVTGILLTHAHFDHVLAVRAVAAALAAPCSPTSGTPPSGRTSWPPWPGTGTSTPAQPRRTCSPPAARRGPLPGARSGTAAWTGTSMTASCSPSDRCACGRGTRPGARPAGSACVLPGGAGRPGHVLTGDTLFPGGPGLTGWPLSDFPTILASVGRLLGLPADTVVHPGHGPDTTVAAERPSLASWAARGW